MSSKMNVSLSRELRKKYGIRSFPVSRGDLVEITGGTRKGEGGKVVFVDTKRRTVIIDGISISKADGKQTEFPVSHSRLRITRLDGTRTDRMEKLKMKTEARHLHFEAPEPIRPEPEPATEENEEKPMEGSEQSSEPENQPGQAAEQEPAQGESMHENEVTDNDKQD